MYENLEALEKTLDSAQLQSEAGFLTPEQSNAFVRQIFDASVLLPAIRRVIMRKPEKEIDKMLVGSGLIRGVSPENNDMSAFPQKPTFSKVTLTALKYNLFWQISEDALEDNIEKGRLEQTVAEHFSQQYSLDLEQAALIGDTVGTPSTQLNANLNAGVTVSATVLDTTGFPEDSSAGFLAVTTATVVELIGYASKTGTTFVTLIRGDGPFGFTTIDAAHVTTDPVAWSPHPAFGFDDGYLKKITAGGNIVDGSVINSGDADKEHYYSALRAMPNQYKRGAAMSRLRWVTSMNQFINWQEYLSDKTASPGYQALAGVQSNPLGLPVIAASAMPDTKILLTDPRNLIFGIWRTFRIRKAALDKESIAQDLRFYAATTRADWEVERLDATVLVTGMTGAI